VKAMREVLGLSQDRFAAKVGLKQQQISAYENRHHAASLTTLAEIATKAGVRLSVTVHAPGGASSDQPEG
jgi:transcriptional regulator with XRE-family HTH domain